MSEATAPFRIVVKGENGRGDQVFEAATPEELAQVFEKSQTHATRKISEQEAEIARLREENAALMEAEAPPAPSAPPASGGKPTMDRERYLRLLATDPLEANRYLLSFEEAWPEPLRQDYKNVRTAASYGLQQQINAAFVREHPELLKVNKEDDQHNCTAINKIIAENRWDYNQTNLEAAFQFAKAKGLLKLPVAETPPPDAPPPPPTVIAGSHGEPTPNADAEFEKWVLTHPDINEVRRAVEARQAAKRAQP